ncbi:MAG: cytochrome c biogenesis protein CcsA [Armatimonadota bacterium]|nr:cytochrome c biogenesis protein CcsA [Armatimonadota bacterium]MDR7518058.1 cytochrome c biogenesis protein CcsA [Armatimonadota bacterium]MDR7550477.1 cytochrome c biogenesis protein CcsA [Armatimonadota bacterium]
MIRPLLVGATGLVLVGAAWALLVAPEEAIQGVPQRIMYVHVPSVITAYVALGVVFVGSVLFLWRRDARWDHLAHAAAELAVLFISMTLISGAIWGKPVWGTWWTWDARLTTTLILWFIYVGYLIVRAWAPGSRGARTAAVIGIVGVLDVPLIHWSAILLRTLHPQPTVLRPEGPALPASMLVPLVVNLAAYLLMFAALLAIRVRQERTLTALVDALEGA